MCELLSRLTAVIKSGGAIELVCQARYIGEVRHRDARSAEVEIHHEEASSGAPALV